MNRSVIPRAVGITAILLALSGTAPSIARIKLVALPDRTSLALSTEHPDETLVEEERVLTLQKGVNQVDFNWQGVSINPSAITFEALDHPGEITLISVKFPPGENSLVWELVAPRAMTERVRVTYFLVGIEREYSYRAIADTEEKSLELKEYLLLRNNSGERLEGANVRTGIAAPYATDLDFGEARQRLLTKSTIPFKKVFTWDDSVMPDDPEKAATTVGVPISYVVRNESAAGLGDHSLRYGKARIFQDDGKGGTAFLGEDWGGYTAVNEELRLGIGESRDIKVTRKIKDERITSERKNQRGDLVLYDRQRDYEAIVENFRDDAATVTLVMHFDETWDVANASHASERKDFRTLQFEIPVAASDSVVVSFTIDQRNLR